MVKDKNKVVEVDKGRPDKSPLLVSPQIGSGWKRAGEKKLKVIVRRDFGEGVDLLEGGSGGISGGEAEPAPSEMHWPHWGETLPGIGWVKIGRDTGYGSLGFPLKQATKELQQHRTLVKFEALDIVGFNQFNHD